MRNVSVENKELEAGEIIKLLRHDRGVSMRQLSKLTSFSKSAIYRWEHAERIPNVDAFIRIVKALDADLVVVKRRDVAEGDPASEEVK